MVPSAQETLSRFLAAHLSSYQEGWEQSYKQLNERIRHQDTPGIQKAIFDLLHACKMQTQLLDDCAPLIYGELHTGAATTLLLYTPYDTGSPASRQVVPFYAGLAALDAYQAAIGTLPVNIKWLFNGAGTRDLARLETIIAEFHTLLQADGCIWSMAGPTEETEIAPGSPVLLSSATRGHLFVELTAHTTTQTVHTMHGAVVPDAAWRLTWALSSLKDAREDILIEGFYDTLLSPDDDEIALLSALTDRTQTLAEHWGLPHLLLGLEGFQFHYAHLLTPTCTLCSINSGDMTKSTSSAGIPAQATAQVDFHLLPGQHPHDIFVRLQQHLQDHGFSDIHLHLLSALPPARTPFSDPFVQLVHRASHTARGEVLMTLPITAGSYPLYPFRTALKLPTVILIENSSTTLQNLVAHIKQIAFIIEGIGHATHTDQ